MEQPSADAVPCNRMDVRVRKFKGKVLVAAGEQAFELEDTAAFVYQQVDDTRTVREIGERLAAEYDVELDVALADTAELIAELVRARALDVR
ncbi:PqqD family protein [Saccharothrix isguenensis]